MAIGRNYAEHASEGGSDLPKAPLLFNKLPNLFLCVRKRLGKKIPGVIREMNHSVRMSCFHIFRALLWTYGSETAA